VPVRRTGAYRHKKALLPILLPTFLLTYQGCQDPF